MRAALEEGLAALERIIATAEERRVDQMIRIAVLLAEEQDPTDAQDALRRTERLLKIMRTQRTLLIGVHPVPTDPVGQVDDSLAAVLSGPAPDRAARL
ncbi:hypothetical protein [Methylobacterium sp. Leaf94]|uniref:hypothetical protein n=1 Tax=Methylobacterium sp. Leaf94 TaxID=1736250 RepID=UPI000AF77CDA|nr:hypothetical protein [Methylobacterium sp. Leaf94]